MSRVMSDAEIRRRKKLQGAVSRTTGTLGLASLGAFGASKVPGAKFMSKTPRLRRIASSINSKKAADTALGLSTAGAGIGGAASYNFAAYTSAESRKKRPPTTPVKKNDMSIYAGAEGNAETYLEEISKLGEWKTIDQRELSQRRSRKYMRAAGGAVGAGAGLVLLHRRPGDAQSAIRTGKMVGNALKNKNVSVKNRVKQAGRIAQEGAAEHTTGAKLGAGAIAGGVAVGGAAKGAHTYQQHKINERRRTHYKASIKKSAFGVDHG